MEVKEQISDGLKRQYSIIIGSADIEQKIQSKLESLISQVNLPGFRPGKVPKNVIRARFGKEVFGEVIKETIDNTTKETFEKNNLKPALQPKIDIKEGFKEGDDLEYTIDIEILPEIEVKDFKEIKLEQMVSKPKEEDLNDALNRLASEQRTFEVSKDSSIKSKKDDAVIIDFVGKINDKPFDGGKAQDTQLILGSGQFIPGFEEQLIGYKSGESVTVKVKFPDNYQSDDLKGKDAVFDVDIKEVKNPRTPEIDDKLAEGLGLKDLTELKERVNEQIQNEYNQISRSKLKKNLLDNLDSYFTFDLPPTLVENEFNIIWQQIEADKKNNKLDDADKSKNEDVLKEEYRVIAERRVKLGLILNDIGLKNDIKVEESELNKAIQSQAQRFPGQEKKVFEYYKSNSQASIELQAPIFEDKVVDFILKTAEVNEVEVGKEKLFALEEEKEKQKKLKKNANPKSSKKSSKKPAVKAKKPNVKKKTVKKKKTSTKIKK